EVLADLLRAETRSVLRDDVDDGLDHLADLLRRAAPETSASTARYRRDTTRARARVTTARASATTCSASASASRDGVELLDRRAAQRLDDADRELGSEALDLTAEVAHAVRDRRITIQRAIKIQISIRSAVSEFRRSGAGLAT